jgi:hypothetical protein
MNILAKQTNGRWAIDGDELNSGDAVMLMYEGLTSRKGIRAWLHGRIEHGPTGYVFVWTNLEKNGPEKSIDLVEGMLMKRRTP